MFSIGLFHRRNKPFRIFFFFVEKRRKRLGAVVKCNYLRQAGRETGPGAGRSLAHI